MTSFTSIWYTSMPSLSPAYTLAIGSSGFPLVIHQLVSDWLKCSF